MGQFISGGDSGGVCVCVCVGGLSYHFNSPHFPPSHRHHTINLPTLHYDDWGVEYVDLITRGHTQNDLYKVRWS